MLRCPDCGRTEARSAFTRRLARRRTGPCPGCGHTVRRPADSVQCDACGWEGLWSKFRRAWQGQALLTGVGMPACRQFVAEWPSCRGGKAQMLAVDGFLHALHDGPLAPLFIAGSKGEVLGLLDELAGKTVVGSRQQRHGAGEGRRPHPQPRSRALRLRSGQADLGEGSQAPSPLPTPSGREREADNGRDPSLRSG